MEGSAPFGETPGIGRESESEPPRHRARQRYGVQSVDLLAHRDLGLRSAEPAPAGREPVSNGNGSMGAGQRHPTTVQLPGNGIDGIEALFVAVEDHVVRGRADRGRKDHAAFVRGGEERGLVAERSSGLKAAADPEHQRRHILARLENASDVFQKLPYLVVEMNVHPSLAPSMRST